MRDTTQDEEKRRPAFKTRAKIMAFLAFLGWSVVALLIADKIHAQNMTDALHDALVRSQTARHVLSKKLQHLTEELDALERRLSKHQDRDTEATEATGGL